MTLLQKIKEARKVAREECEAFGRKARLYVTVSEGWYIATAEDNQTIMDFGGAVTLKQIKDCIKGEPEGAKFFISGSYRPASNINPDYCDDDGDAEDFFWDVDFTAEQL